MIYFSIFRVNQFRNVPHFAAKVAVARGLLVPERETLQGEAYGKEILPWYLPQLKKFSAANPNAVWAIG